MNRYRAPARNGHAASNPAQGALPLSNPNGEPFMSRLERRCTEDPEFLQRLADAVREIGDERAGESPSN